MVQIPGGDLGAVVTFRYVSPTANDRQPMVMLLTSQHMDGHMHGLNLRYLTPIQQQQLQHYFYPPGPEQHDRVNPFEQERIERYQQQVEAEKKQQELLNQEEGYVVRPEQGNPFGVSTFTRSAGAIVQKARGAFGQLRRFIPFGGQQKPPPPPEQPSPFANLNQQTAPQINNPSEFYYQFVKPVLGSQTKNAYRKYNPLYIQRLQIVHTPNRVGGQRRFLSRLFGRKEEE